MFSTFIPTIYVQVLPERLTVRNIKTGQSVSEVPELALAGSPGRKILGVGDQARALASEFGVEIVNPFAHPRSLISDFVFGEHVLKDFLYCVQGRPLLAVSPRFIVHPLGNPAGGLTQVECRAFHEMAMGAGAAKVTLWQGRSLSDQELLSRQFPEGGQVLS